MKLPGNYKKDGSIQRTDFLWRTDLSFQTEYTIEECSLRLKVLGRSLFNHYGISWRGSANQAKDGSIMITATIRIHKFSVLLIPFIILLFWIATATTANFAFFLLITGVATLIAFMFVQAGRFDFANQIANLLKSKNSP